VALLRIGDDAGLAAALGTVQRRAVIPYPTAAARTAELLNPWPGVLTWLEDQQRYEYWTGLTWVALGADAALTARVDVLETKVAALEARTVATDNDVAALAGRVTAVEARPLPPQWKGGVALITTGAEGLATVTHNLGVVPATALAVSQYQVLGGGAITDVCDIEPSSLTTTTFKVRMANNHGDFLNSANLAVWWLVMAT